MLRQGGAPSVAVEQRPWCHVLAARPIVSAQKRPSQVGSIFVRLLESP
jgi:hypothetical protein